MKTMRYKEKSKTGFKSYSLVEARCQAILDARVGSPTSASGEPVQHQRDVRYLVEISHARLGQELVDKMSSLRSDIGILRQEKPRLKEKLVYANRTLDAACDRYAKAEDALLELDKPQIPLALAWVVTIALSMAEIPLNSFIFSLFGGTKTDTLIMASGICFAIPLFSHLAGIEARENSRLGGKFWQLLVILFVFLAGVSYLRGLMMEGMGTQEVLGVHVSWVLPGIMFLAANLLIVGVSYWASYASHVKESRKNRNIRDAFKRASAGLTIARRERDSDETELSKATRRIETVGDELRKICDDVRAKAEEHCAYGKHLVSIYRRTNIRWRKDGEKVIESFKDEPDFTVSESLNRALNEAYALVTKLEMQRDYGTDDLEKILRDAGGF